MAHNYSGTKSIFFEPARTLVPAHARLASEIWLSLITARKRSLGQGNIFTPVCHSVHRGGHAWLQGGHAWLQEGGVRGCTGGCAWLLPRGACMVAWGGMHGCSGVCVVALGGCMVARGACMVAPGGQCMVAWGACVVAPGGCI